MRGNKSKMKRKSVLALFLMTFAMAFVLSACGGASSGGSSSSSNSSSGGDPAAAAKGFFDAAFSGGALEQYVCTSNAAAVDGIKQGMNTLKTSLTASGAKIDTSGLTYAVSNQSGDSADVKVSGKLKTTVSGQSVESDYPAATIKLKNESGWKVCG